jgi:transcriptional regulator with PAS, ATPase and Fis domain
MLLQDGVDLKLVIQHSSDSIFVSDAQGRILLLNPASQELLGLNIEGAPEVSVQDMLGKGVYEPSTALEAAARKTTVTGIVRSKHYEILAISKPVLDDRGEVVMVITSSRSKQMTDAILAEALRTEKQQKDRYRQAASTLSESLRRDKPVIASPAMRAVMALADSVAGTDATVLITGESGTGKELLALHIHHASPRSGEPFIPVNCGAIPHELIESEFFGYARGAFSGADPRGKVGLFEMAHGGTLFLDEIGEMPTAMQTKLLRALETGEVQRVGGAQRHTVNARIIAATNRDLYAMSQNGQFRPDLYYRLHVIPVTMPPLRDRPEDIRELAGRFLDDCNRRHNRRARFAPRALDVLTAYRWPGNVRELRNFVERLVMISAEEEIGPERCAALLNPALGAPIPAPAAGGRASLREFRSQAEAAYIRDALAACAGNVYQTAAALHIHPTALYRKLHALGLRS